MLGGCGAGAHEAILWASRQLLAGYMADKIADALAQLRREIENDRAALAAKEAAFTLLETRFQSAPPVEVAKPTRETAPLRDDGGLFDLADLKVEEGVHRQTFVDDLRETLKRFGAQEFSIAHVEAVLKKLGIEVAGKTPRSRISASLSRLNEDGFLVKTFKGGGNVPHRYRVRASMSEQEAAAYAEKLSVKERSADIESESGEDEIA
jgi:hypothetical protein